MVKDNLERAGFATDEWCEAVGISRGTLHSRWVKGEGPRRVKLGASRSARVIITESPKDYLERLPEVSNLDSSEEPAA